jgi:hypothetical protein
MRVGDKGIPRDEITGNLATRAGKALIIAQ